MYSENFKPDVRDATYWNMVEIAGVLELPIFRDGRYRYEPNELKSFIISAICSLKRVQKQAEKTIAADKKKIGKLSQIDAFNKS